MSVSTIRQANAREHGTSARCGVRRGMRAWLLPVVSVALLAAACGGENVAAQIATPAQEAELGPDVPEGEGGEAEAGAESSVPEGEAASTTTPAPTTVAESAGGQEEAEVSPPTTTVVIKTETEVEAGVEEGEVVPPTATTSAVVVPTATSVVGRDIGASKGWAKPPISENEKQKLIREGGASKWGSEPDWKVQSDFNKSLEWDEYTDSETGIVSVEVSALGGKYFCEIENTQANWNKIYLDKDADIAGCELTVALFAARVNGELYHCYFEPKQENYDKVYVDKDPIGAGCSIVDEWRPRCESGSAEEKVALQLPIRERECDTDLHLVMRPYCRHETEVNVSNWREQPDPHQGAVSSQPELYIIDPYLYFYNTGYERFKDECIRLLAHFGEVYEGP